jgi:hypothetical protein
MNQVIVFPFFGERYLKQFQVCARTIPSHWEVVVITDQAYDRFTVIKVNTPASTYDCLTFRKRIPEFVDIEKYDRVWHCDCDILFSGDLLAKYADNKTDIIVNHEPMTRIDNEFMAPAFDKEELERLILNNAPAINSGLFGVPRCQSEFWDTYKDLINDFHAIHPDLFTPDQYMLNRMYHRSMGKFLLMNSEEVGFPTRGTRGSLVNHYIGFGLDKLKLMEDEIH